MLEKKQITILFVDDEPEVLTSLRRFLRKEPYQTLFASGALDALEVIKNEKPQLLVTDLRMPGMDGLELIHRVKLDYPDMLRMVLSATRELEEAISSINTGEVFRFISKPLEPDSFKRTLMEAVDYFRIKADRKILMAELETTNSRLENTLANLTRINQEKETLQEKARDTDHKIEEQLLKSSVPENLEGVSIAALSTPSYHLDGDFFDFYTFSRCCFDLAIGDVMGKGLQSALVGAGMKQIILRALAGYRWKYDDTSNKTDNLAEIFTEVHQSSINKLIDLEMFLTLCYARFDITNRTMSFIDCGHPKTIHFSPANGEVTFLAGNNLPLGLAEEAQYKPVQVNLSPGDVLLFYSDGITEAENTADEFYGPDRLARLVSEQATDLSADQLVKKVEEDVRKHTGMHTFTDDFTCIAVKLDPPVNENRHE
jgi:sigma-B regulation protein RsbU (phosphoserine phosphatase)